MRGCPFLGGSFIGGFTLLVSVSQDAAVGGANTNDWGDSAASRESWMMDPPFTAPTNPRNLTSGGSSSASNSATTTPSNPLGPGDPLNLPPPPDLQPSNSSLSSTNTSSMYALFENQSIWSLSNSGSESSNLLSWAMLGAAEQQQREKSENQ